MPGATRRMYPARTNSLWLATSASAGSSLSVRTNRDDIRRIMGGRLLARATHSPNESDHGELQGQTRESGGLEPGVVALHGVGGHLQVPRVDAHEKGGA